MTRISHSEMQFNEAVSRQEGINVSIGDAMSAAAEDAWRAGPTQAIVRGVQSFFDSSDKIKAQEANEMYGLSGTSAAFNDDEEITVDRAKAVADDFHQLKLNEFITSTVNEESPYMGRATQFVASMATSLVDPAMLAANVVGAGVVGAGVTRFVNGSRMVGKVNALSPAIGKGLASMYQEGARRSLMTVVAREGAENFVSSVMEETAVQFSGFGQDRLARKISLQESLQNVVAGTVLGGAFGTVMSKDGRKALGRKFGRDYGDDAADFLQSQHIISAEEAKIGIEKSDFESRLYDRDNFTDRPWYSEKSQPFNAGNTATPSKLYLSVDAEGSVHTYSNRGAGTVMTGSKTHAYNKGVKVIELDSENLNLVTRDMMIDAKGRPTALAKNMSSAMSTDIVANADPVALSRAIAILRDPEINPNDIPTLNRNQLRKEIKSILEGKDIDGILDSLDDIIARGKSDYDPAKAVEDFIDAAGYNGYQFVGKSAKGQGAYHGVYVSQKYTNKIKKTGEFDTPTPDEGSAFRWKNQEEQIYKEYADWMKNKAKSIKNDIKNPEVAGIPKQTPIENAAPTNSQYKEALANSVEKKASFDRVKNKLEQKLASIEEGKAMDPKDVQTLEIMRKIEAGEDPAKILDEEVARQQKFVDCMLG